MCNETKVNTSNGDMSSPASKNVLPPQYIGQIETPFGVQYVNRGDALDHAFMRSGQLASLLSLISGEGLDRFRVLNTKTQESILWMARQLADETEAMFEIAVADEREGRA